MARWEDLERSASQFANSARALFDAHQHKTLATLRKDGGARIGGIEATFKDGDLWLGMMPGSLRHATCNAMGAWLCTVRRSIRTTTTRVAGRAMPRVSGRAEEVTGEDTLERFRAMPEGSHLFRIEVEEVVMTRIGEPADHLVIELWRAGQEF